jgi:UDP-N-acetylmuramoyl-tripeptide--D-alanyl-D-alanine ligase
MEGWLNRPIYRAKWAFRQRAALFRRSRNKLTTFVALTGSHGKSTATAMLGAILAAHAQTRLGFIDNTHNHFVRAALNVSPGRHRYCVQEVGASPRGSIDHALKFLRPHIGVVTAVAGDHYREFRGFQGVASEKSRLVHGLDSSGLAVLNGDDRLVAAMAGNCLCRVAVFGRAENADLRLLEATSPWPKRLSLEAAYRGRRFRVETRLVGTHWRISVMAALLTALELGVPRDLCLNAIAGFDPLFSRMSVHPAPNGAFYVLDMKLSYFGTEECLGFLKEAHVPRRTVLLGTVADHPGSDRPHYERIARMALATAERVVFAGKNAMAPRRLRHEFGDRLLLFENNQDAVKRIKEDLIPDEILYVKGSGADRLSALLGFEQSAMTRK